MISQINTVSSGVCVFVTSVFGNSLFTFIGETLPLNDLSWVKGIIGPSGTIICMGIGLRWMTNRLNYQESKWDEREVEMKTSREKLTEILLKTNATLDKNQYAMDKSIDAITEMERVMKSCVHNIHQK